MTVTSVGSWVRRFHTAPEDAVRLVCFPHAGGAATWYFPLSRALMPAAGVLAIQYPGRQDRRAERCVDDLGELADLVARELAAWTDRPFALFGHSMGATVAYEVGRRLERAGVMPLGLFASAGRAPTRWRPEMLHRRDDEGLVAALRSLSGTDTSLLGDEELMRMVLPAIRADYRAVETYRHTGTQRLTCPIHVLAGDSDEVTTLDEARAWHNHTTAPCEVSTFAGGHFYLTEHLPAVTSTITEQLTGWLRTNRPTAHGTTRFDA
ncbi:thioesterase II family protein [Actinophytocola sp.]|uniref:thioesterase II family protein n=1 Tax=Actinophytocola sp. TaxID=1872138 RepID=UPI002ED5ED33